MRRSSGGTIAFSHDGHRVAFVGPGFVTVWATDSGEKILARAVPGGLSSSAFNSAGELVVSVLDGSHSEKLDVNDGSEDAESVQAIRVVERPRGADQPLQRFSGEAGFVVGYTRGNTLSITVEELTSGSTVKPFEGRNPLPTALKSVLQHYSDELMLSVHPDRVAAWTLPEGRIEWECPIQVTLFDSVSCAAESLIAYVHDRPRPSWWNVRLGRPILEFPSSPVFSVLSPDGRHFAGVVQGGLLEIYHLERIRTELEALGLGW